MTHLLNPQTEADIALFKEKYQLSEYQVLQLKMFLQTDPKPLQLVMPRYSGREVFRRIMEKEYAHRFELEV